VVKSASIVNPYKLNKQDYSIRGIDEREIIEQAKFLLSLWKKAMVLTLRLCRFY